MFENLASHYTKHKLLLFIGDTLVFVLVTISGFATHGEIGNITRMLTTFIPLFISWFIIAPFFSLYNELLTSQINQLWRVFWAMIAVVPLAAWLRGLWLQSPIQPIFVLVLGGVSTLAMLVWRALYLIIEKTARRSHG